MKQAFVRLIDEGTDVYRPIEVIALGAGNYEVIGPNAPDDEVWEFPLGSIVTLSEVTTFSGETLLVASRLGNENAEGEPGR